MSRCFMSFAANALAASTSTRWFNPWNGGRSTTGDGGATDKLPIIIPISGTLKNFRVGALTNPSAASGTATYTLVKNGVDTGITIVINLTGSHVGTSASTLAVSAGDYLTLKLVCSVSPSAVGSFVTFSFELEGVGNETMLHFGNDVMVATAGTRFMGTWFATSTPGTAERSILVPRTGTIDKLYIKGTTGSIAGLQTYTLRKNGADTAIVTSLNDNANPFTASDLTHSISVARGDLIALKVVTASASHTASRLAAAVRYTPTA